MPSAVRRREMPKLLIRVSGFTLRLGIFANPDIYERGSIGRWSYRIGSPGSAFMRLQIPTEGSNVREASNKERNYVQAALFQELGADDH